MNNVDFNTKSPALIRQVLVHLDPLHADVYWACTDKQIRQLTELDKLTLVNVRGRLLNEVI